MQPASSLLTLQPWPVIITLGRAVNDLCSSIEVSHQDCIVVGYPRQMCGVGFPFLLVTGTVVGIDSRGGHLDVLMQVQFNIH